MEKFPRSHHYKAVETDRKELAYPVAAARSWSDLRQIRVLSVKVEMILNEFRDRDKFVIPIQTTYQPLRNAVTIRISSKRNNHLGVTTIVTVPQNLPNQTIPNDDIEITQLRFKLVHQ